MKRYLIILTAIFCFNQARSQNYKVTLQTTQYQSGIAYLTYHMGKNLSVEDSAAVTSKGGIHALTKQLAAEFGKYNIRVNTIAPGIIRSPLQKKLGVEDADGLAGLHLLNRIGETSDIAESVYSLATSNFITGEILNVDGGHVAGHQLA